MSYPNQLTSQNSAAYPADKLVCGENIVDLARRITNSFATQPSIPPHVSTAAYRPWCPVAEYSPLDSNLHLPQPPMSLAQRRGLPPLPTLPDSAPSKHPTHPYSLLSLHQFGSGNASPAPPSSECAECIITDHFKYTQMKHPGSDKINLNGPYFAVEEGSMMVNYFWYKPRSVSTAARHPSSQKHYVLIADLLEFRRISQISDAHCKWVRHPENTGLPVEVTFVIIGNPRDEVLLETKDVLYLNCAHRKVTHCQVGYYLAWAIRHLIKTQLPDYNWRDFELVTFHSADCRKMFTSVAQLRIK
ncbi:hypothetical protein MIND_00202600 [Mycena indigotica]|uniref:Uncharacterized protein n=1 Tax=Mycena indigotica TaxID=2126181 RepID=A0A8H6WBK7_9AGAR|nr:uncharacterized protein MIND_00202600 [Mycena indigotica]KAF7311912.1 hypothetical protein MIND_00202600 [Mycena indigotica]